MRIKKFSRLSLAMIVCGSVCGLAMTAQAQQAWPRGGHVFTADSSIEDPTSIGTAVHTHLRIFVPDTGGDQLVPPSAADVQHSATAKNAPPLTGYYYLETPASLACVYNLVSTIVIGCNPYSTSVVPTGGSKAIAIVDAGGYPTALADLTEFSSQFGLPAPNLTIVYASASGGTTTTTAPAPSSSWELEEALDIEWAHAMAPNAKIYLVEAQSSSMTAMMSAVAVASALVKAAGGGEVSMSWGSSEFSGENSYDSSFTTAGVVYLASAGDAPGVEYPSSSPNVIAVGGTSLSRNPVTGNFQGELSWQQTGGGPSAYETRPSYQSSVSSETGAYRGVPDVAAVADPTTGVWVYEAGSWYIVGGTSVASPVWAGIINSAGKFNASTSAELATVYGSTTGFNAIASGDCGPYEGYLAVTPWSFCTGHGSPSGSANK